MISALRAQRQRVLAVIGAVSMYRLVLVCLAALIVIAVVLSAFGVIVSPGPLEILATLVVLIAVVMLVDAVAHRVLGQSLRVESSLITAYILLFVLRPGLDFTTLGGAALAGVLAALSKYLLVWHGRHLLNPAAFGATIVTIAGIGTSSSWWVGTPVLFVPVLLLGLTVLWRTERVRIALLFFVVAVVTAVVRQFVQGQQAGLDVDLGQALSFAVLQTPFLFLGAFMLSEPLTLPSRRWQQLLVAALVGVLAGWPIAVAGMFTLGQERALLLGNVLAFLLVRRRGISLRLQGQRALSPTATELVFDARGIESFRAGQYLELTVPHAKADARGTRREFSIVSAPADLPTLRVAYRNGDPAKLSSYKRAVAALPEGASLSATGVWGDFVLPDSQEPVLLLAAGIGVTPFIGQLRQVRADGDRRDIVLVYVASSAAELIFREELEELGVRVAVFTPDDPGTLASTWTWSGGVRLNEESLLATVPDVAVRHVFVSGPPRLIADLSPALRAARTVTTDAFAGY